MSTFGVFENYIKRNRKTVGKKKKLGIIIRNKEIIINRRKTAPQKRKEKWNRKGKNGEGEK